ncbi:hypothetical protein U4W25_25640 (plasmid) [Citrobacter amalonaticus]|uniref:hypothetical protein n=1 Tax=Citrobacter amalonaticus TaxID=35703 RepID=UPI002B415E79|nr:hypothetical protein [Citrobacter amalonaticus]WQJ86975.1 hypothetical protein U4W25_25640 [Citrobacter amalonaticus]
MLKRWNIIFLFLFLPLQYAIADIHGEIIRIIDGDTVDVLVKEGANKQVMSSQADSLIKISRIWADFFPANTSNQPI